MRRPAQVVTRSPKVSVRRKQASDQARARAAIYHALAEALAEPVEGIEDLLLEAAKVGAQVLGSAACQRAALRLAEVPRRDPEQLRSCYTRQLVPHGARPVALYESLYRYGRLAGPLTWELEKRFRALGLSPPHGELPDHASVELAFLGHLAMAEAEARDAGDGQLVARLRAEQRQFLRDHAVAWLPGVGAALAAGDDPFYAAVGHLLREFLAEELRGRAPASRALLPTLNDPASCTLCGLCVGSCPLNALQIVEDAAKTALVLHPSQCVACDRCRQICPERVLLLRPRSEVLAAEQAADSGAGPYLLRDSPRAKCPHCGRPTVSEAELRAVFARLQANPALQRHLSLCVECKSWGA